MATKRNKAKKTAKKSTGRKRHRASWRGNLVFGLVSIPVEAFNALNREESDIHFHQLHADCHRRIQYQKVCPLHGEVTQDEIVSGYEYAKGKYVEIEPEELDAIRTEQDRALTIDSFVEPTTIDPLYLDGRMYYLMPSGNTAAEPYAVMVDAMEKEKRYGIGNVVMFGKEQLALVRPLDGLIHMAMLNFDEEIRPPAEMKVAIEKPAKSSRQVTLARALIRNWFTDKFDFTRYDDQYRKRVARLIKSKVAGKETVKPKEVEDDDTPDVINLMEALKRSVDAETKRARKTKPPRKKRA